MLATYHVGVIGATGKGNYGHGLDAAFQGLQAAEVVAVADDSAEGLKKAGERLGVRRLYREPACLRESPNAVPTRSARTE